MAASIAAWRTAMLPATWRGIGFKVDHDSQSGGRRNVTFEFPKRDTPYTEDMGRRAKRWQISGYIIGPDYLTGMNQLIAALDQEGFGTLVHPFLGTVQANVDNYTVTQAREKGGMATFEMSFVEAGNLQGNVISVNTSYQATTAATSAQTSVSNNLDTSIQTISA